MQSKLFRIRDITLIAIILSFCFCVILNPPSASATNVVKTTDLVEVTVPVAADTMVLDDISAGVTSKTTLANIFASAANIGASTIVTVGALDSGSITSNFGNINIGTSDITAGDASLTGALIVTGSMEAPNGTSGTTDATGEFYLDTNGDTTNIVDEVVQWFGASTNRYLFLMELPLAASQDNYVPTYNASTKTVQWEAAPGAAGGDPDQNLWETIAADTGSVAANTITDTFTIAGGTNTSTAISGDTLTINVTGGAGDVTAGANLGDNLLIRGDGAVKGVQNTGISIDDSDNMTALGNLTGASGQMTITGGTASGDDLLLQSTSNGTKGTIALGSLTAGLVYDETNVRLSIGSDENTTVVNTTAIGSKITTHTEGATDLLDFSPHRHSDTAAFGAAMGFARSRGSEGAETAVQDNDFIMRINGYGHDGTDYEIAAQIDFVVDGTVGANQMGGAIVFSTTADGANSVTERMRIANDGAITFGSGTPDMQLSTGSGVFTWASINGANNNDLAWDLETGATTVTISSSTSVNLLDYSAIGLTTTGNIHGGTMDIATFLTIAPVANPTTDADGEFAVDIDGWGTGFDAIEFFNSTASAYVVATTAGDTPTNGQVPKWNTGGEITWENDTTGAGSGAFSDAGDPAVLNTTTKDVVIGTAAVNTSKLTVDGDADQVQLTVQENGTQTDAPVIVETSAGAETMTVEPGGLITTLVGLDAIGAVDMDYGSADVTDHTFTTDSTGDAEIVLPDDSIGPAEILTDAVTMDSIDADGAFTSLTGAWATTGLQSGGVVTKSTAASYTVGTTNAAEAYGGVIYVTSAATITMPAVSAGMHFTIITIGATAVSVDTNASDRMYLDGTALDDGDKATNTSTTGDILVCVYESASGWYCGSGSNDGTLWTDGGP